MHILVTGGAGYIGSFMTKRLLNDGHTVSVLDSLERGHKQVLDTRAVFLQGNLLDKNFLQQIFSQNKFDGVINFAGYISMAESMEQPVLYFENNTLGALNVLEAMIHNKTDNFIFSSTAGVYGNPTKIPIPEAHPKNPTNPYGESKLMVEKILAWYQKIHNLSFTVLRYFNAAGAALDGSMGENHVPESHIIPNAIRALLAGKDFTLFGTDYKTNDGTCVRDYIHILDLVEAHVLALERLHRQKGGFTYNVGTGNGYSNKEVIQAIEKVSGKQIKTILKGRRPGDADQLIADATAIRKDLEFKPKYSDIDTIVKSAWAWHTKK